MVGNPEPTLVFGRNRTSPFDGPKAPLIFGAPPKIGIKPLGGGLSRARSSSVSVEREWSGKVRESAWNVKAEDLEMVPLDFPLERTHREIVDDASLVASRITGALADLSIEAEYDDEKARAKCKTSEYVCFRIRLFSGGEGGQPVVVELQRRSGSASVFMHSCRAILNAAEGKAAAVKAAGGAPGPVTKRMPPFMKVPISQMKCLQPVVAKEAPAAKADATVEALEKVMSMLRRKQYDSRVLALENLCCLTDPVKTSPDVAVRVSKYVALGDEKYDIREELREMMERDVFLPSGYVVAADEDDDASGDHAEHLRCLAFRALANALQLCSKDGCLVAAVKDQVWFAEQLIPSLQDELKMAETSASIAQEAASSLHSLLSCSDVARRQFVNNGGLEVLQQANEFGVTRHALLAEETGRCMGALGVVNPVA